MWWEADRRVPAVRLKKPDGVKLLWIQRLRRPTVNFIKSRSMRPLSGPLICWRVGRYGKPVTVYKFRSMRLHADRLEDMLTPEELAEYHKNYKLTSDPRVTKVGALLRKTSLDELPQLFNILMGQLSLVGPRPVLQEETELYGDKRSLLLSCKPGLTGLWQSRGRSNVTYENGRRQEMELRYVRERSLWLEFKILLWTVKAVVRMDGAR